MEKLNSKELMACNGGCAFKTIVKIIVNSIYIVSSVRKVIGR